MFPNRLAIMTSGCLNNRIQPLTSRLITRNIKLFKKWKVVVCTRVRGEPSSRRLLLSIHVITISCFGHMTMEYFKFVVSWTFLFLYLFSLCVVNILAFKGVLVFQKVIWSTYLGAYPFGTCSKICGLTYASNFTNNSDHGIRSWAIESNK